MGRNIQPDRFEAMDWYMKAAAQGHSEAKKSLENLRSTADAARKGRVPDEWWMVPLDELIQKAEQGDAGAQYDLGRRYKGYGGTPVDLEKARFWLEKSAAQTNQAARFSLSQLYVSTTNMVPENAFYHCSIAAEAGYRQAQRTLGKYYRDGFGTASDRGKAFHWLCLAEQAGDDYAQELIYSLIQGRAAFKEKRTGRVAADEYSPPPIEMTVRNLDGQEQPVKFIKYDPKTKRVHTDCTFGESKTLPLVAFHADSYPVIQNAAKTKGFENALRLEINKKTLTRTECEELGYIGGQKGSSKYKHDGAVYELVLTSKDDFLVLKNLDVESRCYSQKTEQWSGAYGKSGAPRESQTFAKKSFKVDELKSGVTYDFETDPLVVESYSTEANVYYNDAPTELQSKILGVAVRVFCEMADGTVIYRDFYEPVALKSKVVW